MAWLRHCIGRSFVGAGVVAVTALGLLMLGGCEVTYRAMSGNQGPESGGAGDASGLDRSASVYHEIPVCAGDDPCLRVVSFNTKHRDVPIQMAAVAQAFERDLNPLPDFLLLQEVVFGRPSSKEHADTGSALAAQIGMKVRGSARAGGEEGLAILSRHPFTHYEALHLADRDAFLSGGFPRVSVMGEFDVDDIGLVRVVNVHLAHRPSAGEVREKQLNETISWMVARQEKVRADVIIFGGDFNIQPSWDQMQVLRDSWPAIAGGSITVDVNAPVFTSGKIGSPHRRVDYIFAASPDREIRGVGEGVLWLDGIPTVDGMSTLHPSDHLPFVHVYAVPVE